MSNWNITNRLEHNDGSARNRSVITEDVRIEGNVTLKGIIEFGGQIIGDLTADAVILTPTSRVHGRIRARQLTIDGELKGAATALHVSITNGAKVKANFAYATLEIASGAEVFGEYKKISTDSFTV